MKNTILAIAATTTTAAIACTALTGSIMVVGDGEVADAYGGTYTEASNPNEYSADGLTEEWLQAIPNNSQFIGWQNCPEAHQEHCRITYNGASVPTVTALFAPYDAQLVTVQTCTSGILPASYCSPYVGKTFALVFDGNTFQAVGWDNRVYTGSYGSNMFSGSSADGELMTAYDNGTYITIALYPNGHSGCSGSAPNCVVSLKTGI
jgi:hypothetical protein